MSGKVKNYRCWFLINQNREQRDYEPLEQQAAKVFLSFIEGRDYGGNIDLFRFDIYIEPTINLGLHEDGVYTGCAHISSHVDHTVFNQSTEIERISLMLNASLISIKYLAQRMTIPKGFEADKLYSDYENYLKEESHLLNDKQLNLSIIKPFNNLRFNFVVTTTVEVKEKNIHYKLNDVEDFVNNNLSGIDFGTSVHAFHLGYEIADSKGYMQHHAETANLKRYGAKYLLVVKQFDYDELKQLDVHGQFKVLKNKILEAISDISSLNKKPKDFKSQKFFHEMTAILSDYEKRYIIS
ncbi:hypothetical protein [Mucilaginibacter sp.]|uniref:hypothetical protein n=1 Tax=Mucilaginibacter sp. TaxID=1882438 RepID=UPI002ED36E78